MTLEELEENEDEFGEEDEAAIEMYRWVDILLYWVTASYLHFSVCYVFICVKNCRRTCLFPKVNYSGQHV